MYAGQEAIVRTGHGTTDWFQIGKGVRQGCMDSVGEGESGKIWKNGIETCKISCIKKKGCILSPCLFNLYTEYVMRNAGLEEAQAGIKIAGRNINNLRYADDTNPYGRK